MKENFLKDLKELNIRIADMINDFAEQYDVEPYMVSHEKDWELHRIKEVKVSFIV